MMTLSTALARLRAAARTAIMGAGLAALGLNASAQEKDLSQASTANDVYIGVFRDDVKPIVMFVFSDPSTPELKEVDAVALFPRPDYRPPEGGEFAPAEACLSTTDFAIASVPPNSRYRLVDKPIYGPNSTQGLIDPASLPSYMAREAVGLLVAQKLLLSTEETVPYFNCTGFVWSALLNQPPEFWDKTYKELVEQQ